MGAHPHEIKGGGRNMNAEHNTCIVVFSGQTRCMGEKQIIAHGQNIVLWKVKRRTLKVRTMKLLLIVLKESCLWHDNWLSLGGGGGATWKLRSRTGFMEIVSSVLNGCGEHWARGIRGINIENLKINYSQIIEFASVKLFALLHSSSQFNESKCSFIIKLSSDIDCYCSHGVLKILFTQILWNRPKF